MNDKNSKAKVNFPSEVIRIPRDTIGKVRGNVLPTFQAPPPPPKPKAK
ncbi:hypothetical protein ACFS5N_03105 [Mucilaginibacter ximonensis]|uniref:Uncharacterized protein n=1 Tax=Mucilaginibacter ximonensis TaxID=538021 RepID=A0ABW5Y9I9_9SPHI